MLICLWSRSRSPIISWIVLRVPLCIGTVYFKEKHLGSMVSRPVCHMPSATRSLCSLTIAVVSQCPIAPEKSYTYSFTADQYGTSWYHSHYSAQYADGTFGAMIIYGPEHVPYDIDVGPVLLVRFAVLSWDNLYFTFNY